MRSAAGFGASALVLIITGVAGWVGAWALGAGAVSLLLASVCATNAMDSGTAVAETWRPAPERGVAEPAA